MDERHAHDITALLSAWNAGDASAKEQLIEAAYPELHRIALGYFRSERASHTLQCTALIHEAYLRLAQRPDKHWENRAHFFGFAARLMRTILVDYARSRQAAKRGEGMRQVTLTALDAAASEPAGIDVLDLHAALEELETLDAGQSRIVELRYFGGLTVEETARAMGVSESTVKREWTMAKTWIRRRLKEGPRRA